MDATAQMELHTPLPFTWWMRWEVIGQCCIKQRKLKSVTDESLVLLGSHEAESGWKWRKMYTTYVALSHNPNS